MPKKELVLELGVEGGGATIYRTPLASGGWKYHVGGSSICLDDKDNEDWRSWKHKPVQTVHEALDLIQKDGHWVFFYPMAVHPDYRIYIWELLQTVVQNLPPEETHSSFRDHGIEVWRRLCLGGEGL